MPESEIEGIRLGTIEGLPGVAAADQHVIDAEVLAVAAALVHKLRHQNAGADEIDVVGLSGLLADDQHVIDAEVLAVAAALVHQSRHIPGGADPLRWTDGKLLLGGGAGADPTLIDVPGGVVIIRKTADETVNNSIVLQNDDSLALAIGANEIWLIDLDLLLWSGNAIPDFKFGLAYPVGCTAFWGALQQTTPAGNTAVDWSCNAVGSNPVEMPRIDGEKTCGGFDSTAYGGYPRGVFMAILRLLVMNGGNAGNLQLQWCQNTAHASDNKILENSFLQAWQIG